MTARRPLGLLFGLIALLLCAAPASAAARLPSAPQLFAGVTRLNDALALMGQGGGTLGLPGRRIVSELRFENRDGYTISVVAFGQTVGLSVSRTQGGNRSGGGARRGPSRRSTTTYLAHGKVTPTSIAASFGDRGRIAVRFRPSGRRVHSTRKAGCKKPTDGVIATLGVFAGVVRFDGEGGYTSAEVHRVRGRTVDFNALLACLLGISPRRHAALPPASAPMGIQLPGLVAAAGGKPAGSPAVPTHPSTGPVSTSLVADSKQALSRTVFAAQERDGGQAHFLALDQVSEGSIGVVRFAYARGAPSTFRADATLSSATATPPPPFSGTATLEHRPQDGKSWAGSLAVSFLGAPHVALTGAPFNVLLARGF